MPRGGNNEFLDFSAVAATNATHLPIVVWHGLGELRCASAVPLIWLAKVTFAKIPFPWFPLWIFSKTLRIRRCIVLKLEHLGWFFFCCDFFFFFFWLFYLFVRSEDAANGWIMSANNQVTYACNLLGKLAISGDFYGLGLSQGGLFMRALLQRYARTEVVCVVLCALLVYVSVADALLPKTWNDWFPSVSDFGAYWVIGLTSLVRWTSAGRRKRSGCAALLFYWMSFLQCPSATAIRRSVK